ncbi:MAG: hypothetical protein ABF747_03325 [Bifidobacterium sp.]|uniref:3-hydroxy-3-methylglutaryl coenzyme A reductase n=1 Tax=Bifidobacterium fermentum TaxID=3059035 RepID=A0AB39UCY3_9BIFI
MTAQQPALNVPRKIYQMSVDERLRYLVDQGSLSKESADAYRASIVDDAAARMSENVIGELVSPLAVVTDLLVNGEHCLVPMTTEEPSVVAAANHGARMATGGFAAASHRDGIYGQILLDSNDRFDWRRLTAHVPELIRLVARQFASLSMRGGGLTNIDMHEDGLTCELLVKVGTAEAMGANIVNSILECMVHDIESVFPQLNAVMAIVSNYPSQLVDVETRVPFAQLGKDREGNALIAHNIARMADFAERSPYRAVTNNKGIMNGVDAVVAACGNDTRAVEAACHQLAALSGRYMPLSHWSVDDDAQHLVGTMRLALPIGAVGGAIASRSAIMRNMELMGSPNVKRLGEIIAATGLANNLAALHALAGEGIQHGHMRLQAAQTAIAVGATADETPQLVSRMVAASEYSQSWAAEQLADMRDGR